VSADPGLLAQLVFWAALLLGFAVGGAVGAWKGFNAGGATAGLIMGAVGLTASGYALYSYWKFWQQPNVAAATVLTAETPDGADQPVATLRFTTRDGMTIETRHGGPLPSTPTGPLAAGDTIAVLYGPDPTAVTLHSVRGSLVGGAVFGMFSTFAFLVGLFFLAQIADEAAVAHRVPTSAVAAAATAGTAVVKGLTILSNVVFLSAFVWLFIARDDVLRGFRGGGVLVAAAGVGYAIASMLTPTATWSSVMIPLIVGIVFGMFSAFLRFVI
jgi:hypothetical protein